ncbi:MAG: decaprenyl-phosphate phosphoribosyltransferase [Chloroflexota bacterium]
MEALLNTPRAIWQLLPNWLRGMLRVMRPRQWAKNILIFVPIAFDRQISLVHLDPLLRVIAAFVLFCVAASAVYVINDLVDVERDRQHPKKKYRPIASGQLSIPIARVMAVVMPILAVGGALLFSLPLALILFAYLVKQIAYSFYFKNVVIMDVMLLAAGYILRIIAGVVVITVTNFSPWLYVCAGSFALFLAVAKRRQELIKLGAIAQEVRPAYKDYNLALLDDMLRLVTTSSVITYTLYTVEAKTNLGGPAMLLTVPFVVYGIFRYLYLMHVKGEGGAPDELLFKDRPLLIDIVLFALLAGAIIYVKL